MSKIFLLKRNLPKIFVLAVLFLTISASTVSAVKLAKSFAGSADENIPDVLVASDQVDDGENEPEDFNDDSHIEQISDSGIPKINKPQVNLPEAPSLFDATNQVIGANQTVETNQNPNSCIITLFGMQYDVTSLRTTHSGGDVFTCGADNSGIYQSEHGTNVSRMQAYLVGTSGTVSGSATGTTTTTTKISGEDDDEEEEYERQKKELERELEAAKKELENAHENEDD